MHTRSNPVRIAQVYREPDGSRWIVRHLGAYAPTAEEIAVMESFDGERDVLAVPLARLGTESYILDEAHARLKSRVERLQHVLAAYVGLPLGVGLLVWLVYSIIMLP